MKARAEERRAEEERRRQELGVDCLHCKDTGHTDEERYTPSGKMVYAYCEYCERGRSLAAEEEARARAAREKNFRETVDERLGAPTRFRGLDFDTFPDQKSPVLAAVKAWVAEHDGHRGLFLTGPFGRGKSTLLLSALRALVIAEADRRDFERPHMSKPLAAQLGCFRTGTGLLQSLRPSDGARAYGANEDTLVMYQRVRFLAIDDLGAERLTAWGADRLFEIVNERHNELRPMLLTSNLSLNQLATRWNQQVGDGESGDRIVNRLVESCDVIAFPDGAPNWRMRKGAA